MVYVLGLCLQLLSVFFFVKQKTAYEMRISDLSSDVCSSDLIDDIAGRFGHLLAAVEHEAMPEHLFGQRDPRRHQERRPVDRVEADDILADQMKVRRPPAREIARFVGEIEP